MTQNAFKSPPSCCARVTITAPAFEALKIKLIKVSFCAAKICQPLGDPTREKGEEKSSQPQKGAIKISGEKRSNSGRNSRVIKTVL